MATHPKRNRAAQKMAIAVDIAHNHEVDYSALLDGVRTSFDAASTRGQFFLTDVDGLNEVYLDALPSERQTHNCHACRQFLQRFGGLVTVADDGKLIPAMWDENAVPAFYEDAFVRLQERVSKARIVSPFYTPHRVWGSPVTGSWSHMAVTPAADHLYRERALNAGQAMAAARENFRTVSAALSEFTPFMLDEALRLLRAEALVRSEKFITPVQWLRQLHDRPKGRPGENLLWRAIGAAPEGFCHPKASVIGPLLDDIAAGMPVDQIRSRFAAKLDPLQYQRPQAAPSAGNIRAAEALVAKLGIAPALERRFARLDEIRRHAIWLPQEMPEPPKGLGIFSHLKPKDAFAITPLSLPTQTMTWAKFASSVLPIAEKIEFFVPEHGAFIGLVTRAVDDAPPILKWDHEDERNPVSWFVYPNGSAASQWGLMAGRHEVSALVPLPPLWGSRPAPHLGVGVIAILPGAVNRQESGNALFPECLKDELHGARATIEAYSRSAKIGGREEASACGYDIRKSDRSINCRFGVLASGAWSNYIIDRWD